jgi:multiple sugar transport system substrate-binding protein
MTSRQSPLPASGPLRRRQLLKLGALGLAAPAAGPLLAACGDDAGAGADGPVTFEGWDYEPNLVQQNIDRFTSLNPDIEVNYTPITSAQYVQKIIAEFTANNGPDALYVYDDTLAGWVEAGYLEPIDGLPGVDELYAAIYESNAATMSYQGKRYGLPYYTDCQGLTYNAAILSEAGIDAPPTTLDEWAEQAVRIKDAGLLEYPIGFYAQRTDTWWAWIWALVFASGGDLFDDQGNPTMTSDPTLRNVLAWLHRAANDTQVIDPASLQTNQAAIDPAIMEASYAYTIAARYSMSIYNNPEESSAAGDLAMGLVPTLDGTTEGTVSHTRMYCLSSQTAVKDKAFQLMSYLGGLDENGEPYTAKFWFLERGLGFAFTELGDDPEVIAELAKFIDPGVYAQLAGSARARNLLTVPWYYEFEGELQSVVQEILTDQTTPEDAVARLEQAAGTLAEKYA